MPTPPPALPGSLLPQSHHQYAQHLFANPLFPDCTIRTRARTFRLHRCVLAPRCEFFHSCFTGSFEEAATTSVTMLDDDPDVLERMLRWLYTLEFPTRRHYHRRPHHRYSGSENTKPFSSCPPDPWTSDLDLWMMADKYGLTTLMEQCVEALMQTAENLAREANLEGDADSDADADADADTNADAGADAPRLKNDPFQSSAPDFVDMMSTLFTACPTDRADVQSLQCEILAITAPVIAKSMRSLPVLQDLVTQIPGFAVLLVETLSSKAPGVVDASLIRGSSRRGSPGGGSDVSAWSSRGSLGSVNGSRSGSEGAEGRYTKTYIPMNEDSEDEL